MKELAESDTKEVVETVQEIFCDYLPFSSHLYSIPLPDLRSTAFDEMDLRRCSDGLMALLLSLRKYPSSIRYGRFLLMSWLKFLTQKLLSFLC